ncbi:MAG: carotenoid biosynthesis protein [Cytophagaceae bacterium]|nr:carotenoid biosynthesis protein [Cytophagaceae bacterium]MDW8456079.1 carotenoid biosynthesis protein [Cytophagaceae bacterium]
MYLYLPYSRKLNLSIVALGLLHSVGLAGMAMSDLHFFSSLSPYNLLFSAILVLIVQKIDKVFIRYLFVTSVAGFMVEVAGVNSGVIFGVYEYGNSLGLKVFGVPLIIGINWWLVMYGSALLSDVIAISTNPYLRCAIASALAVSLDAAIEPVASKLDFWYWQGGSAPIQNYIAWFVVSFVLQLMYHNMPFTKKNKTAIAVFAVQSVFFIMLNILI